MLKSLLSLAVLATLATPVLSFADEAAAPAAEPASPHTVTYNIGLYSQYVFRGLTQTGENAAIQGGVDYAHSSGFYAGTWASNISWLEDGGFYDRSSLELDLYGGFASTIGDTGVGYNVGLLQYVYPGDKVAGAIPAGTTEIYASLSYSWIAAKVSVVASSNAFGVANADGTWYAELNANYPIADTGITANVHVGRQDYSGAGNDIYSYTDWKLGATKSWSNGVNLGAYYTDTNATASSYQYAGENIADNQFVVFVQKTF